MLALVQNLVDALSLGSIYALTALGIGLIFSVMRLINFAHGSFIALCTFSMLTPVTEGVACVFMGALPAPLLIVAVLLVGIVLAVGSEALLFRKLRGQDPAVMMVASFALATAAQSLLLILFGGRPVALNLWPGLSSSVSLFGVRVALLQLVTMGVTAICLAALVLFLTRSRFGIAMRASAENFQMAEMLGVPANRIIMAAFAMSGALAAITCLLLVPQTGVADIRMGGSILMMAFVATVVGGLGNLTGAVLAGFMLGLVSVALQIVLPVEFRQYRDALVFAVVILTLLFRPQGLFAVSGGQGRV